MDEEYYEYLRDKRHRTHGSAAAATLNNLAATTGLVSPTSPSDLAVISIWRQRERVKTIIVVICVCLNIGIDPPDIVKPTPCARLEAWIDPLTFNAGPTHIVVGAAEGAPDANINAVHSSNVSGNNPQRALETVAKNLQAQYELWQPRARFKLALDPAIEDTKKAALSARRNTKDDRVLFHYNGHGVPKPTPSGELWVFNKNYTQYIPLSIYDLQTWLGSPSIYVYDCSAAGNLLVSYLKFAEQRDTATQRQLVSLPNQQLPSSQSSSSQQQQQQSQQSSATSLSQLPTVIFHDSIQLAACSPTEILPMQPELPADLFTCCLTTPIEMSLRWFVLQNRYARDSISLELVARLPGRPNDRRTPLGELNWIFTAITDTVAWTKLPRAVFRRLFRQDLMVAALFRNFLFAQRVMQSYGCTPMSYPELPDAHQHPLWASWDLVLDLCIAQLPMLVPPTTSNTNQSDTNTSNHQQQQQQSKLIHQHYEYIPSSFFAEQLTAFEVWLTQGVVTKRAPEQLPIVLQVLLSQAHRLRALILLSKFLDLGPWAVDEALQVGIFPYVLKLLQSPSPDLKPVLVFIWSRIFAVDISVQNDLTKDNGFSYFIHILSPSANMPSVPNASEHKAMCCFVLASFCYQHTLGQQLCLQSAVLPLCLVHLNDSDPLLRQWTCICLGQVYSGGFVEAAVISLRDRAHEKLSALLLDLVPEVRAAAVYALGQLLAAEATNPSLFVHTRLTVESNNSNGDLNSTSAYDKSNTNGTEQTTSSSVMSRLQDDVFFIIAISLLLLSQDAAPMVRKELVITLSQFVVARQQQFVCVMTELCHEELQQQKIVTGKNDSLSGSFTKQLRDNPIKPHSRLMALTSQQSANSVYSALWKCLLVLSVDPEPVVSQRACVVVDHITSRCPSLSRDLGMNNLNIRTDGDIPSQHLTIDITMPLKSELYEWSREYFTEPQMKPMEDDEPGSLADQARRWRTQRNHRVKDHSLTHLPTHDKTTWSQSAYIQMDRKLLFTSFHPYEPYLFVVDDARQMHVVDWTNSHIVQSFDSGIISSAQATSLELINEAQSSLLAIGSDDGIVRVWHNVYSADRSQGNEKPMEVTAWRALTDMFTTRGKGTGLVMNWVQSCGCLVTSGDSRVIRIWDLERESAILDLHTRSATSVTSLATDLSGGQVILTSCGDGAIRVYDRRKEPRDSMVMMFKEHKSWAVRVQMQPLNNKTIASASVDGIVKIWDLRKPRSIQTIELYNNSSLSTLSLMNQRPIIACGSSANALKMYDLTRNDVVNTITSYTGFLGQRLGKITTTSFHPWLSTLAAGAHNGVLSVYSTSG